MPDAPPKGKPKGKGKGLGKKVGPLPLWAWLAIAAGAAGVWYFFLRGQGGGGGEAGGPSLVTGASPQDMAQAGAPSQNAAPGQGLSSDTAAALAGQGEIYPDNKVGEAIRNFIDQLNAGVDQQAADAGASGDTGPSSDVMQGLTDELDALVSTLGGIQTGQAREAKQLGRLSHKVTQQAKTIKRLQHTVTTLKHPKKPAHHPPKPGRPPAHKPPKATHRPPKKTKRPVHKRPPTRRR